MIYAKQANISGYFGLGKNMDTALRYLQTNSLKALEHGRNEVDGDNVYINRFDYETLPYDKTEFEAHEFYADIHVLLSGEEQIGVADINKLCETQRDKETDFVGYSGDIEIYCPMSSADFLIAFPEDAHVVKLMLDKPCMVEKAVFKVKL